MSGEIVKPVGEKLLRATPYRVTINGTQVTMELGEKACTMDYDTAINLAVMLNWAGRKAKQIAGDGSMRMIGIADLTDANADERQIQKSRDGTAAFASVR